MSESSNIVTLHNRNLVCTVKHRSYNINFFQISNSSNPQKTIIIVHMYIHLYIVLASVYILPRLLAAMGFKLQSCLTFQCPYFTGIAFNVRKLELNRHCHRNLVCTVNMEVTISSFFQIPNFSNSSQPRKAYIRTSV